MKKIALVPNPTKDLGLLVTAKVADKLSGCGADVYMERTHADSGIIATYYDAFPNDIDLMIVIGGDGSVLDASVTAIELDIPVLGINLGKVGYLSEVETDNLDVLCRLFDGNYKISEKMLLEVSHVSGEVVTKSKRFAVNDVIVSHNSFLGIAEFKLETSGADSVKYRADGIIFSTPQGSTAYSLSAGGPVVSHSVDCIVANPICPHSFFNRSIIFKSDEKMMLKNDGDAELNVSVDGRYFANVSSGEACIVGTASKKFKMITFNDDNMFSTLFRKMKILEDVK